MICGLLLQKNNFLHFNKQWQMISQDFDDK